MNKRKKKSKEYFLDIKKLEQGDIVLTTTKSIPSKAIRVSTLSGFSHALLYVGQASYIDSDMQGVHANNILRLRFSSKRHCKVLRPKVALNKDSITAICNYARERIGTTYSVKDAIRSKTKTRLDAVNQNRQFCSRLVAQAYYNAEVELVVDPNFCTPEEINKSNALYEVESCLIEASPEEFIGLQNPDNDQIKKQEEITNSILVKARQITKIDIQTLEQLLHIVYEHPKFDEEIASVIESSGFLKMWEWDLKLCPEHYSYELLVAKYGNSKEIKEYAAFNLEGENDRRQRFSHMFSQLSMLYILKPLKTISIQIELYEQLIELSIQRETVWELAFKEK